MIGSILVGCGAAILALASIRSYGLARRALAPLAHEGDPTRTAIEASRPLVLRPRVRRIARDVAASVGWLAVAMYGLFLVARGAGMPA